MVSAPDKAHLPASPAPAAAPGRRSRGRRRRRPPIAVPIVLLVVIFGACLLLPLVYPLPDPTGGNIVDSELPPFSPGHLFGTDSIGNDVFSRILYGGRVSLFIAIAVNLIGLVLGGLLGAFSGYRGGAVDSVVMRVLDVLIAFPSLVLAMAIAQSLGPSVGTTILALCFFSVPAFARTARAATIRLREETFVAAARLSGTRTTRMLLGHVTPNIAPGLVTFGLLNMGITVVVEGALSFLQLGIPPPGPSWGNLIYQGQESITTQPMLVVFPCAALFLTTLAFNLLGDALRGRWNAS